MHSEVVSLLNSKVPGCEAVHNQAEVGDDSVTVNSKYILDVCKTLKEDPSTEMNVLQVISTVDFPEENELEVVYILASFLQNTELLLKTRLPRGDKDKLPSIESVTSLWKAADFQEREAYDMMGINFIGHPDLRRILCTEGWEGYPLRKDYVAAEVFNGMEIYPESKMNFDDREFGVRIGEKQGGATSVKNYVIGERNKN